MSLSVRHQAIYWGIAAAVFLLLLRSLGNVMLPFLVGGAIAYFLDPVADRLERLGLSRKWATAVITIIAVLAFVLLSVLILPALMHQLIELVNTAPTIFSELVGFLKQSFPDLVDNESIVPDTLAAIGKTIQARGGELAGKLLSSAMTVINALVFIVVAPVVAFYLLLDWDHMVAKIDAFVPRDHQQVVRQISRDIDKVLAGFVRGQVSVCLILGTYYSVFLMAAGLQYGLIVGAIAGLVTFIPYVGALIGGTLAMGLALYQYWGDWTQIGIIAAVFAFGQTIESNIITPRLVGKSVGLHPVWLLFALSAFGSLFGFVGMLVAVPVTAAIGVLIRFGLAQYKASRLYQGVSGMDTSKPARPEKP